MHISLPALIAVSVICLTTGQEVEDSDFEMSVTTELPVSSSGITFKPTNLTKIRGGTFRKVHFQTTLNGAHHAVFNVTDKIVSVITGFDFEVELFDDSENVTGRGSFNVSALFLGYNVITLTIYDENNNTLGSEKLQMSVVLSYEKMNKIFTYILGALITMVHINMGATIDLNVVKQIVKKPVGPLAGLCCQFLFMPVIAFGLAKLFFSNNSYMQLGLFLNGASPGGGASNMWTLLLGGSLDLSIMMTFVSTVVAFAAVPIWVMSLGPLIAGPDADFAIPYGEIAMIVALLVIPCAIGLGLQFWLPKVATFLETRVLKPFALFMIIFVATFGIYSYRYVFQLLTWKVLVACFGLPALGYSSGIVMSIITRRTLQEAIAISIEVGIQNANIAIVILKVTLEAPSGDLAVVVPACCVLMTPIPLIIAVIVKKIVGRIRNSGGKDINISEKDQKQTREVVSTISYDESIVAPPPKGNFSNTDQKPFNDNGCAMKRHKLVGVDNPGADFTNDVV